MISNFNISLQGSSHLAAKTPCQDRSATKQVKIDNKNYVLSAIADGLGSYELSGEGAEMAIRIALWYIENYMVLNPNFDGGCLFLTVKESFNQALNFINKYAKLNGRDPKQFSTTLTVSVYDGDFLLYGHCGDGGIVTMNQEGKMDIITSRHKGEEATSVVPIQHKRCDVRIINNVVSFAMMTDGVLDAYVRPEQFENRIYGNFFKELFRGGLTDAASINDFKNGVIKYLNSEEFRKRVNDDISLTCVVNQDRINSIVPQFDEKSYNCEGERIVALDNQALYGGQKTYNS